MWRPDVPAVLLHIEDLVHYHKYRTYVRESRQIECLQLYRICMKHSMLAIRQDWASLGVLSAPMYHPHL